MVAKPILPEGYSLPETVNGWVHDPDSPKNGHTWRGVSNPVAVTMYSHLGSAYAAVRDTRVRGDNGAERIFDVELSSDSDSSHNLGGITDVVDRVVEWMKSTSPGDWENDVICESVFTPPPGYELESYNIGARDSRVYYHREDADEASRLVGVGAPDEYTLDTCPYLTVHVWNGSENATISVAPWTHSHDHERREIVDAPPECGLERALELTREYGSEHQERKSPAIWRFSTGNRPSSVSPSGSRSAHTQMPPSCLYSAQSLPSHSATTYCPTPEPPRHCLIVSASRDHSKNRTWSPGSRFQNTRRVFSDGWRGSTVGL